MLDKQALTLAYVSRLAFPLHVVLPYPRLARKQEHGKSTHAEARKEWQPQASRILCTYLSGYVHFIVLSCDSKDYYKEVSK